MKWTKESFLERAHAIHGDKYDYSKVEYVNTGVKICIVCPEHGEFWKTPTSHLNGQGCPICSKKLRSPQKYMTQNDFIKKSQTIHENKYDYSKVSYIDRKTEVCIICPTHGEFWQKPSNHLKGYGCKKCAYEVTSSKIRSNTEDFLEKVHKKWELYT